MHRRGHVGLGLLAYAPIAFALTYYGELTVFGLGLAWTAFFSVAPDFDLWLPFVSHRGITHTFLGGTAGSLGSAAASTYLLAGGYLPGVGTGDLALLAAGVFVFAVSLVGFCSHLVGDVLTPMGIAPFWPGSSKRYSLSLVYANNSLANGLFSVAGSVVLVAAIVAGTMARAGTLPAILP